MASRRHAAISEPSLGSRRVRTAASRLSPSGAPRGALNCALALFFFFFLLSQTPLPPPAPGRSASTPCVGVEIAHRRNSLRSRSLPCAVRFRNSRWRQRKNRGPLLRTGCPSFFSLVRLCICLQTNFPAPARSSRTACAPRGQAMPTLFRALLLASRASRRMLT